MEKDRKRKKEKKLDRVLEGIEDRTKSIKKQRERGQEEEKVQQNIRYSKEIKI